MREIWITYFLLRVNRFLFSSLFCLLVLVNDKTVSRVHQTPSHKYTSTERHNILQFIVTNFLIQLRFIWLFLLNRIAQQILLRILLRINIIYIIILFSIFLFTIIKTLYLLLIILYLAILTLYILLQMTHFLLQLNNLLLQSLNLILTLNLTN
jgi:hypothetical protein